jgi:predicted nucleic acid-binding protein
VRVVLDGNVVFAGVSWRGEAHQCLLAMAKRRITVLPCKKSWKKRGH